MKTQDYTVGIHEAKTHLSAILNLVVTQGQSFKITRHGTTIAYLMPSPNNERQKAKKALEYLKNLPEGEIGPSAKELITEGRK